jgi:hypothetical protein
MEEKIRDYLLSKYKPQALLIHGSRANGNHRPGSDWDFAAFVNKPTVQMREIIFETENIDMRIFHIPIIDEEIKKYCFYFHDQNVKVIHDPKNITEDIIKKATLFFNSPRIPTPTEINSGKNRLRILIAGMEDYKDEQEAFFRKLCEFYQWSLTYWFWMIRNSYMQQVYKSLPIIKKEDPDYYNLLQIIAGNGTNDQKIEAAKLIHHRYLSL